MPLTNKVSTSTSSDACFYGACNNVAEILTYVTYPNRFLLFLVGVWQNEHADAVTIVSIMLWLTVCVGEDGASWRC